jgi:stromal membrane-associated protein
MVKIAITITNKESGQGRGKEPEKPVKPLRAEKLQRAEDQSFETKKNASLNKAAESIIDLLGLDGPAKIQWPMGTQPQRHV